MKRSETVLGSVERQLFIHALEKPAGKERAAFLNAACEDPALRRRLEALLSKVESLGAFLEEPAVSAPADYRRTPAPHQQSVETGGLTEKAGDRIGRYKLLQPIGEGGCGVVYMGEQEEPVRRRVALKVIRLGMDTKNVIARFEAERQALALMDHPNIAKVLDAGSTETGRPYFVMELVRGTKITQYCDQHNLSTKDRVELFIQICRAIQHAHQKGIIHRDIKPSNILVTLYDGIPLPKVIDFGIAKATTDKHLTNKTLFTQFEQFIGTPAYMSPEQAELGSSDIDTRSDIYSLGVLLYELLTGKTPFDSNELLAAGLEEMRRTIREKEPMRPSTRLCTMLGKELTTTATHRACEPPKLIHALRGDLDWIVMKSLEKDRTRRYETANGFAMDLQRHLNHDTVTARPPSRIYRFRKMVRRNRFGFAAAAGVAATLVFGVIVSSWQWRRAENARTGEAIQRQQAEKDRQSAQVNEQKAKSAQTESEKMGAELRRHLYVADMKAAFQAMRENKTAQAWELVQRHHYEAAATEDLRGFEWRYLWKASQSGQTPLWSSPGWVTCAVFSPNGKMLAATGLDAQVVVVDTGTRVVLTNLNGFDGSIDPRGLSFSSDGRFLAAKGGHDIRVWSTENWKTLFHWTNGATTPYAMHNSVIISPDGETLATRLDGGGVGFWDLRTGRQLEDRTIRENPKSNTLHFGAVMAYSRNGSLLVIGDDSRLQVREARSLNIVTNLIYGSDPPESELRVTAVAFSTNSLAIGYRDGTLALWDLSTWRQVTSLRAHSSFLSGLDFSPGGEMLASGGIEEAIAIWEVKSLLERPDLRTTPSHSTLAGHEGGLNSVTFSQDGKWLASASHDGTVRIWDFAPLSESPEPITSDEFVWISADGKQLITGEGKALPRLWDISAGAKSRELNIPDFTRCSKTVSPDGKIVAVGRTNGAIELWDVNTCRRTKPFTSEESPISQIEFSADGRSLITAHDKGVTLRNLSGDKPQTIAVERIAGPFTLSRDGSLLAGRRRGGPEVQLWDISRNRSLGMLGTRWHLNGILGAFSPDGRLFAVPTLTGPLEVWDVVTRQLKHTLRHPGPLVTAVTFAPDGKTLAASTVDAIVIFWNTGTWSEIGREVNYAHSIGGGIAVFSSNGEWLALRGQRLANGKDSVVLWHAPSLAEIDAMEPAGSGWQEVNFTH